MRPIPLNSMLLSLGTLSWRTYIYRYIRCGSADRSKTKTGSYK